MKRLALISLASFVFAPISFAAEMPKRVASTSLCGDSYVLALVDQKNIAALSWQSRGALSGAPDTLKALPQARDDAEVLFSLNPDLIIFGPGEGANAAPFLRAAGMASINLKWGEGFETIAQNYALIGEALGLTPSDIPALPNMPNEQPSPGAPSILYLSRSGGTAGPGTLVDAAIRAAGGRNIIEQPGWRPAEPESLITLKPDLIVTSYFNDGLESAQSKAVRSRALQNLLAAHPVVDVPGKYWPCAGPGLYEATRIIKAALNETPS